MKKHIKLLSMLMIVMMVCTLVSSVFAADYADLSDLGYVEAKLDKTVALEGNTVTLTIKALKPVTDYELRVTPTGEGMFEVTNKLQGSVANKSGNTRVLYMIQLAAQADKTVYPAGTELATLTYVIPEGFYASNKDANDVANLGVNIAIKITDNGKNQSYTLTRAVKVKEAVYGDVTCDGVIDVTDTTHLSRYIDGVEGVTLDAQALKNADVNKDGNVNEEDLKLLGMYLAAYFPGTLPEKPITDYVLYGDANRDGKISGLDIAMILSHINGETLDEQALKNADVNKDSKIDNQDIRLIAMYITDWFPGTLPEKPITNYVLYGDVNCDGLVDTLDRTILTRYLDESFAQELSAQGLKNADINNDGNINEVDRVLLSKVIGNHEGYIDILPAQPITDYVIYGDVTCDGFVDDDDYNRLDKILSLMGVDGNLTGQALKNADANNDGEVDFIDLYLIRTSRNSLPVENKYFAYKGTIIYSIEAGKATIVSLEGNNIFIPSMIGAVQVSKINVEQELGAITLPANITIENLDAKTIITATRNENVENYTNIKGIKYIVVSEVLQEKLKNITLENNTVGDFIEYEKLVDEYAELTVVVKDANDSTLTNDDLLGTGSKIQVLDRDENVVATETICLHGEINGDGVVDFFDVVDLISLVYDMPQGYVWNEAVRSAAKFGAEGEVDFFDITTLISHIYDNN